MLNIDTRMRARLTLFALILVIIAAATSLYFSMTSRSREERMLRGSSSSQLISFLKKYPENPRAFYYLGIRLRDQGKLEAARVAFRQGARLDPESEQIALAFADSSSAVDSQQEAFDTLNQFLKHHPNSGRAHLSLAVIYQSNKIDVAAYKEASAAVNLLPKDNVAWRVRGGAALKTLRISEAEADFRKSLALNPNDWRAEFGLAYSFFTLSREQEAISHFQRAQALNPNEPTIFYGLGRALLSAASSPDTLNTASRTLERAVALDPSDPGFRLAYGEALSRQKRWRDAKEMLIVAERAKPENPEIHFRLSRVYQQLNDTVDAAREDRLHQKTWTVYLRTNDLENRCAQPGHAPTDCLALARLYVSHGDNDKALAEYRNILAQVPDLKEARGELASLEAKLHHVSPPTTIAASQSSLGPLVSQADDFASGHQYSDAERLYRKVLSTDSHSPLALQGLALVLYAQGKRDEAFKAADLAVHIDPTLPKAQFTLAQIYYKAGLQDEAVRRLVRLVAQVPDNPEYVHALGSCYSAQSLRYAEAEVSLKRAVELSPNNAEYLCDLAIVQALRQNMTDAERNYRLALQIEPDNPAIQSHFGSFLADHLPNSERAAESDGLLRKSLIAFPNDTAALASMGRLSVFHGDDKAAVIYFERVLKLAPGSSGVWYELAREYRKLGNSKRADVCMAQFRTTSGTGTGLAEVEEQARQQLKDPALRLKLARLYAQDGQNAKAIDQYQNYFLLHGTDPSVQKELKVFEDHLKARKQMPDMSTFDLMVKEGSARKHG